MSERHLSQSIVNALGLSKGDKLEVFERDGIIYMVPVIVYPKKYVDGPHGESSQMLERIRSGEQPVFDSIDELIDKLEEK